MKHRYYTIDRATEGTRNWILRHPHYLRWVNSTNHSVLWIKGKPGSGKSTLMKYFLHTYEKYLEASNIRQANILLSFFFHRRGSELQKSRTGFFRSLLYDLLSRLPSIGNNLLPDLKRTSEEKLNTKAWSEKQLHDFLKEVYSTLSAIATSCS